MKVLIADNDEAVLQLLTTSLKGCGFKVVAVRDAVQAWLSVLREVPDLAVMDVNLPGGSGLSVVKSMKGSSKTSHIPVILTAASKFAEMETSVTASGADAFRSKPLNIPEFIKIIDRLTGRAAPTQNSPSVHPTHVNESLGDLTKILVADDDAATRLGLSGLLNKWNYQVVTATTGDQALRMLSGAGAPRLAVLDWEMPGVKGIDICRQVRGINSDVYTYMIILTSKGFKDDMVQAMDAGADDYIVKPFDAQEIRARLGAGKRILELQDDLWEAKARSKNSKGNDLGTFAADLRICPSREIRF
jgi:DNA-binding response OmpR family regulator